MHQDSLNELEAAMLKKRLKFLRAQGATGNPAHRLGDDFFKRMEDHWTSSSALSDISAVREMGMDGVMTTLRQLCLRRPGMMVIAARNSTGPTQNSGE